MALQGESCRLLGPGDRAEGRGEGVRSKLITLVVTAVVASMLAVVWTPLEASATTISGIEQIKNCDQRVEQFGVGADHHLYHRWQNSPGGSYSGWSNLNGYLIYNQIQVARNVDCRLEAFGVGYGGGMWHIWQTKPQSGPWSNWASLGGGYFSSGPHVQFSGSGQVEVLGWIANGSAYVCDWQTVPGSGPWSGWHPSSVCSPGASV